MVERAVNKLPAHDKWVCLRCRWTAKIPLLDVRVPDRPSYRCPRCRAGMLCAGAAFRPPRKGDDEAWLVLERIFATGFRFRPARERRRVPRTLRELDAWLAERARPETWLPERRARIRRGKQGVVVHCGNDVLADGERLLVWSRGEWREGTLGLRGDGGIALQNPVVRSTGRRSSITLSSGDRLRLSSRRDV